MIKTMVKIKIIMVTTDTMIKWDQWRKECGTSLTSAETPMTMPVMIKTMVIIMVTTDHDKVGAMEEEISFGEIEPLSRQ